MARILHVAASPRPGESFSRRLAEAFIDEYRKVHPGTGLETLDLFAADLPAFDAPAAAAKYAVLSGQEPRDHAARVWAKVIETINRFKSADVCVLSCPMWNFSIPYRLKQYLDIIVQPGLTFAYDPQKGYSGLVTGRRAVMAMARGGDYSPQSGAGDYDMQLPYLKSILAFIGITDVHALIVQPTMSPDAERALAAAVENARRLARVI